MSTNTHETYCPVCKQWYNTDCGGHVCNTTLTNTPNGQFHYVEVKETIDSLLDALTNRPPKTACELVAVLSALIRKYGDLPIIVDDLDNESKISRVCYSQDEDGKKFYTLFALDDEDD